MGDDARRQQLIGELAAAFPRNSGTNATARLYVRELADLPLADLERAVRVLMRTSEFFPTIRAVRETVAELTLDLPDQADALVQLEDRMAWGRQDEPRGEPPPLHPIVRQALDHVGGWHAFRSAEKQEVVRGQFLRLFRELRAARIRDVQVGRELAPGPTRSELTP